MDQVVYDRDNDGNSYAFGKCPNCGNIGYHKQKKDGKVYANGEAVRTTRFKCRNCKKWFGFIFEDGSKEVESETEDWIAIYNYANSIDLSRVNKYYGDVEAIRNIRSISSRHCTE